MDGWLFYDTFMTKINGPLFSSSVNIMFNNLYIITRDHIAHMLARLLFHNGKVIYLQRTLLQRNRKVVHAYQIPFADLLCSDNIAILKKLSEFVKVLMSKFSSCQLYG